MVDGWSWCWYPQKSGLCCVQLAVFLTTHRGFYQWLSLIAIKENFLSRHHHWNLDRRWSGSNLPVAFINSDWRKPPLMPPSLESGSSLPGRPPSTGPRPTMAEDACLNDEQDKEGVMIREWWRGYWNWWWLDVWTNGDVEIGAEDALMSR